MARRLMTVLALVLTSCASRKPVTNLVQVPVRCGPMPALPVLCIETLAPDAAPAEVVRCFAESTVELMTHARQLRTQFAPCAEGAKVPPQ